MKRVTKNNDKLKRERERERESKKQESGDGRKRGIIIRA